jgi:hypothetical protein
MFLPKISARRPRRKGRCRADKAGELIEFEVTIGAAGARWTRGEEIGNRIGLKQAARPPEGAVFDVFQALAALARKGALWQGSARSVGALWADSRIRGMLP